MTQRHPYCSRPLRAPTMGPAGSGLDKCVEQGRSDQGEDVGH